MKSCDKQILLVFLNLQVTDSDCLLVLFTDPPYQQHPQMLISLVVV
jgi:hypothetical protein